MRFRTLQRIEETTLGLLGIALVLALLFLVLLLIGRML